MIDVMMIVVGFLNIWLGLQPNPPGSTLFGENIFGVKLIPWIVANTVMITFGIMDVYIGVRSLLT